MAADPVSQSQADSSDSCVGTNSSMSGCLPVSGTTLVPRQRWSQKKHCFGSLWSDPRLDRCVRVGVFVCVCACVCVFESDLNTIRCADGCVVAFHHWRL